MKKFLLALCLLGAVFSFSLADDASQAASQSDQMILASRGASG
ncbi:MULTISPECIES: hypothetical protein [Bacillus]|nr:MULTISPECIES: hypothetical protein [Bacillus]WFA04270.1 hypothetical protein P3X63_16920 [Bacillus sp. HSf4]